MYQTNNRFIIGLFIVASIASLTIFSKNLFIIVPAYIVLIGLYLTLYFISLNSLNKLKDEVDAFNNKYKDNEFVVLSKEEAKQMKKEGAFEKDGKYMIDEDFELWKKNQEAMKTSQRLQSLTERN